MNKGNDLTLLEIKEIASKKLSSEELKFLGEVEKYIGLNCGSSLQQAVVYFLSMLKSNEMDIEHVFGRFGEDIAGLVFNSALIVNEDEQEVILKEISLNTSETNLIAASWYYVSILESKITDKDFIKKLIDLYSQDKPTYDFSEAMKEFI